MMETMSMEYAQYGIRINNISPGAIVTEHTREKFSDPKTREETLEMIPAREIGEAQDISNVALFLASDLASYIHGTTIYVDGGMTNYPAFMGGKDNPFKIHTQKACEDFYKSFACFSSLLLDFIFQK